MADIIQSIRKRVQELVDMSQQGVKIALVVIGAISCIVGVVLSTIGVPYLAMWFLTQSTSGGTVSLSFSAFGSLTSNLLGSITYLPMAGLQAFIPTILIFAGAGLSFGGIRKKGIGIAGGIIAVIGPAVLVGLLATDLLMYNGVMPYPEQGYSIRNLLPPYVGFAAFGAFQDSGLVASWSLGAGSFMPLAGGILAMIGSGLGKKEA